MFGGSIVPLVAAAVAAAAVQDGNAPKDGWAGPTVLDADGAPRAVRLNNVGELSPDHTLDEELRGARKATPSEWPATFYSSFGPNPRAPKSCTSSLVGAKVVLTAAHCVADRGQINFEVVGQAYTGVCRRHPAYEAVPRKLSADYALCLVGRPVAGTRFESVLTKPTSLTGNELLLTGFGCTNADGTGGNDETFRIGEADVKGGPYPPDDNHMRVEGDAVVCFGDSGGPAFLLSQTGRKMVSVNSLVENAPNSKRSYLASTFTPDAVNFFRTWQADILRATPAADVKICGLDPTAGGCR